MERVRTAHGDILAYRTGHGRDGLAALLLTGFGALFLLLALGISRDQAAVIGLCVVVGASLSVAGAVAFLRALRCSGFILDLTKGTITVWRGVVIRLSATTRELAGFNTVLLSPARIRKRTAAGIIYQVGLHGAKGEPLALFRDETYLKACRFAVELAAFVGLRFQDAAGTEPIGADHGDGRQGARMGPPAGMQCRLSWHHEGLVIAEPRVSTLRLIGGPLLLFLGLALPCLGSGAYLHFFGTAPTVNADPLVASAIVVALLFLLFVAVVLVSMPHVYQRQLVEADEDWLRFKTVRLFATKETVIKSADVTELRVAFGHLTVVTPRELRVVCGRLDHPLPRAELEWLRQELWRALKPDAA
jgi:hypothetical protein